MKRRGAPVSLPEALLEENEQQRRQQLSDFQSTPKEQQAKELAEALVRQHLRQKSTNPEKDPLLDEYDKRFPPPEANLVNKLSFLRELTGFDHESNGSLLELLFIKLLTERPHMVKETSSFFEFSMDGEKVTVSGHEIGSESAIPMSLIARLGDLDMVSKVPLGKGAGGIVSKCRHLPDGKFYAVKEISIGSEDSMAQVTSEIGVLWGTTSHQIRATSPFVVHCAGIFFEGSTLYIAMELMEGSLKDGLERCEFFTEESCCAIAFQVLRGLEYLHYERKQLHRDIKPHNLLYSKDGIVKLTDFGIASKKLPSAMPSKETFCGTLLYMSPARASGREYSYDADLWGLGMALWQMALGKLPFKNSTIFEIIQMEHSPPRLQRDSAQQVAQECHTFSAEMCDFVNRCLETDPRKFGTVRDLLSHPWFGLMTIDDSRRIVSSLAETIAKSPPKRKLVDPLTLLDDQLLR